MQNQFLLKRSSNTKLRTIFFHLEESNVTHNIIKHFLPDNLYQLYTEIAQGRKNSVKLYPMLSLDHILSMLLVQSQYSNANLRGSQMLLLRYYVDVDI